MQVLIGVKFIYKTSSVAHKDMCNKINYLKYD